jgi:hypothetical protein
MSHWFQIFIPSQHNSALLTLASMFVTRTSKTRDNSFRDNIVSLKHWSPLSRSCFCSCFLWTWLIFWLTWLITFRYSKTNNCIRYHDFTESRKRNDSNSGFRENTRRVMYCETCWWKWKGCNFEDDKSSEIFVEEFCCKQERIHVRVFDNYSFQVE